MHTATVRTRRPLIALGVTALVLAACSGSDDESGADTAADSTVAAAVSSDVAADGGAETVETDASDAAAGDETESESASGGGNFCDRIREFAADDSADGDIASAVEDLETLAEDAPDEVRDDLETVIDAFSELADLDENDPDSFVAFLEVFDRPEVVEASENLERYGVEECGLEPSAEAGEPVDTVSVETGGEDSGG